MFKSARVLFFALIFFIVSSFILHPLSFAQSVEQKPDLHNYTQNVMIEVASSLTCMLAGIDPIRPEEKCLGIANGKVGPVDSTGGVVSVLGGFIAMTFDIPVHTGDYARYLAGNFGIVKPAYAQGIGLEGLSPLIPIWTTFRNIVYLLFVLLFVIIGFAIMLRIHIDPRTVMTIENQIPKIIISLILVTFSFAIAGFLIDLMYVFIYLVVNVFSAIPGVTIDPNIAQATNPLQSASYLANGAGGIGKIASDSAGSVAPFFGAIFDNNIGRLFIAALSAAIGRFGLADIITDIVGGISVIATGGITAPFVVALKAAQVSGLAASIVSGVSAILGGAFAPQIAQGLGWILVFVVLLIAIIWAMIRLWFSLLKAYIMILIDIAFAPFWILLGGVPGSKLSFEAWLRDIGSNLLAFPAAIVMFLLARTFMDLFAKHGGTIFTPPLIGNPAGSAIGSLVGLGILLLTPSVVDMMRKALKAPDFDLSAIFQGIGVGTGAVTGAPGGIAKLGRAIAQTGSGTGLKKIGEIIGYMQNPYH